MPLATGLPLGSGVAPVAVVNTVAPTVSKESSSGQVSYAVVTNIPYRLLNANNALIGTSTNLTSNTSTGLPATTIAVTTFGLDIFGQRQSPFLAYANTVVTVNQGYTIGRFTPNNYLIPISTNFSANTGTVFPLFVISENPNITGPFSAPANVAVITNVGYNLYRNTPNNALIPISVNTAANTGTVFPLTTLAYNTFDGATSFANVAVVTNVRYNLNQFNTNNALIPISVGPVANTTTVLPTTTFSPNFFLSSVQSPGGLGVGSPNFFQSTTSNTVVVTSNRVRNNEWLLPGSNIITLAANTNTTYNTNTSVTLSNSYSSYVVSRTVATFANDYPTFLTTYLGSFRFTASSLVNTITSWDNPTIPIFTTNQAAVIIANTVSYGSGFNSNLYGSATISNNASGITFVPAYTTTTLDYGQKSLYAASANSRTVVTSNLVSYGSGFNSNLYGSSRIANNIITQITSLVNTVTDEDFGGVNKGRGNATSFTTNVISYGSAFNSNLLGSGSISNNAPGLTYVPVFTTTVAEVVNKPFTVMGFASSVTLAANRFANLTSSYYTVNPLRIDTTAYANSIFLIRSGFATSFTNFYSTGGGFDPNSPYLGSSTAYWS